MMRIFHLAAPVLSGVLLTASAFSFENQSTTLSNHDSRPYEFIIKTACDRDVSHVFETDGNDGVIYDCGIYYGRIEDHSRMAICAYGCELTIPNSGQTIAVTQGDAVVIDNGVMKVR